MSHYSVLGEPPIDDAVLLVAWANKAGAVVLWEILRDPILDGPTRWKMAAEYHTSYDFSKNVRLA